MKEYSAADLKNLKDFIEKSGKRKLTENQSEALAHRLNQALYFYHARKNQMQLDPFLEDIANLSRNLKRVISSLNLLKKEIEFYGFYVQ